jgi:hypothetical protein
LDSSLSFFLQVAFTHNISHLLDLVRFGFRSNWLEVQDFINARSSKNMMITSDALVLQVQHLQTQVLFEGIEVFIRVQQNMIIRNTIRSDEGIYGLAHSNSQFAQSAIVASALHRQGSRQQADLFETLQRLASLLCSIPAFIIIMSRHRQIFISLRTGCTNLR